MQLLLVTFDLTRTIPGDSRYTQADATLSFNGTLFRPLKQNRLLLTSREPKQIMAAIEQRIGRQSGILIVPVTSVSAWRIHELPKRKEWDRLIAAIKKSGIKIDGITPDYVSS
jgi:hypothetical protein